MPHISKRPKRKPQMKKHNTDILFIPSEELSIGILEALKEKWTKEIKEQ